MKNLLIALLLLPIGLLGQDTSKAKLWRAEGKGIFKIHRAVDGYVILTKGEKPKYLTLRKRPFKSKYCIEDYYIICK